MDSSDASEDWCYGGNQRLGDSGYDTLPGGGNDRLFSENADLIDGGSGNDVAVINRKASSHAIKADLQDPGRTQLWADGAVTGSVKRVEFYGGGGAGTIRPVGGADQFIGGGGGAARRRR